MRPAEGEALRGWLLETTGLQADLLGRHRLERAVAQRERERDCIGAGSYRQLLLADPAEQQALLERLVVGESWFLREPRSFAQLQALARQQPQRPLRVLSCGCSSGEEPYSVVMALVEAGLTPGELEVDAIDISAVALARAGEGLYGAHALRGMDPQRLARFFQPEEQRWRLRPEIRGPVRFHRGTLPQRLTSLPGGWHAVLCRNVMLYLGDDARRQLLIAIAERLAPGGMLLVAAAEAAMVPTSHYQRLEGGHGAGFRLAGTAAAVAAPPQTGSLAARPSATPAPLLRLSAPAEPLAARPALKQRPLGAAAAAAAAGAETTATQASAAEAAAGANAAMLEPTAHLDAARRLRQLGQAESALGALRRCLYLDPDHLEALELMADLAGELGREQEAERQRRRLQRSRLRRDR